MFGQKINVGHKLALHAAAGLCYARTNSEIKAYYKGENNQQGHIEVDNENVKLTSDFSGIGPRLALDGNYDLTHGFEIIGGIGGSLLAGTLDTKYSTNEITKWWDGTTWHVSTDATTRDNKSKDHIVPECDAQLGVNYTHRFANSSSLIVGAGWKITHYFNVIENVDFDETNGLSMKPQDLSFSGPFLGVTFTT